MWAGEAKNYQPKHALACQLNSTGWGAKRIYNKHPEIPISTIKYTIQIERKRLMFSKSISSAIQFLIEILHQFEEELSRAVVGIEILF